MTRFLSKMITTDKKHIKFVNSLPCCTCNNHPKSEASHIRRQHDGGMGIKPSDYYIIPQCHTCHEKVDFIITRDNVDEFKLLASSLYAVSGDWKEGVFLVFNFRRKYAFHNKK